MLTQQNKIVGSNLIGQYFTEQKYFWGRPSATTPFPYNAMNSSGSNLGPSNPDFLSTIKNRAAQIQKSNPTHFLIPVDLITASGSGLDPEISPFAAYYQIPRIVKTRHIAEQDLQNLITGLIKKRTWGILGEPRINILELNLALDNLQSSTNLTAHKELP